MYDMMNELSLNWHAECLRFDHIEGRWHGKGEGAGDLLLLKEIEQKEFLGLPI